MTFVWDEEKARKNVVKHGIDFETACRVFGDPFRVEWYDSDHSSYEERYITIGMVDHKCCILFVSYTEWDDIVRIISARKTTEKERRLYYDRS